MYRNIFILAIILSVCFLIGISAPISLAKTTMREIPTLPEKSGIYDAPGKPGLKLKIFVHREKSNAKKTPVYPPYEPKCMPDADAQNMVSADIWKLPARWEYTLNISSMPSSVTTGSLAEITNRSLSTWINASDGYFQINQTNNPTAVKRAGFDGRNIVAWGSAPSGALAVTYIWFPASGSEAVEIDTIMNNKYLWTWTPYNKIADGNVCGDKNSYDAQNILTHEIGHWFGLDDEYDAEYSAHTMFGYGSTGEIRKDTLTAGDISGLMNIYAQ